MMQPWQAPPAWAMGGKDEDDDDDDEIQELKAEVKRLKKDGEAREKDILIQQLAEIRAALAGNGGKNNMTEMKVFVVISYEV